MINGYIYTKALKGKKQKEHIKYLRCQHRAKCKGRALIRDGVAKVTTGHNHPKPDLTVFEFKGRLREVSSKAWNAHMSSLQVYNMVKKEFLEKCDLESEKMDLAAKLPSYKHVKTSISRYLSKTNVP